VQLLRRCAAVDEVIGAGDESPEFDIQAPLMSLPLVFQTRLETIPAKVPYLFADAELVDMWRQRLAGITGFRIGINWQGRQDLAVSRVRDIPLECFAPIAATPDVRLIRLQKGEELELIGDAGSGDPRTSKVEFPAYDPGTDLDTVHGAFMDTAAIMMNLDLVITSDTAVAHLAGALGVPVWVGLPFAPDWRWLLDRSDSPWYPTMRLFRQQKPGDWPGVCTDMAAALRHRAAAG
jgi:hypothetical protein